LHIHFTTKTLLTHFILILGELNKYLNFNIKHKAWIRFENIFAMKALVKCYPNNLQKKRKEKEAISRENPDLQAGICFGVDR
jgi:hypothetical protein